MREFTLCKSCLKDCGFKPKKFRRKLEDQLGEKDSVELTSCLKLCPRRGLSFMVEEFEGKKLLGSKRSFVPPEETSSETVRKILEKAGA